MEQKHGDLTAKIAMTAEPSRLFRFWRSTLRDAQPETASVIIKKQKVRFDHYDTGLVLESVMRTERKRADLSLSEKSLQLGPHEIQNASILHDLLWGWLSKRQEIPVLDTEMASIEIHVTLSGEAGAVVTQLEDLFDFAPIRSVGFGIAYLEGRPPRVEVRWPKPMTASSDLSAITDDVATFEELLAPGQTDEVRSLAERVAKLFRKRGDTRRRHLQRVASQVLGDGATEWLTAPGYHGRSPVQTTEDFDYTRNLEWLEHTRKRNERPKRTHAWRAND